jgi:hypothetical protein
MIGRTIGSLLVIALLAGAVRTTRQPSAPVRLSVDAATDPVIRRCLAGANGTVARFTDDEPLVAVDPRDAEHLVAIWQTRSGSGAVIQWVRSIDGGRRWSPPRVVPINACAGGPVESAVRASDPWVTIGPDGRIYLSAIAWAPGPNDGPDLVSALVVVASADGGATWDPPVAAAIAPSTAISHDNLAITADPTRRGTIYAATTRAERPGEGAYFGRLGFTRSTDGGRTWEPIRPITPAVNRERIGAPQVVVDPRSGRLYAVYHARVGNAARLGVRWSDDQGESWTDEVVAAAHVRAASVVHPVTGAEFVLADDIVQAAVSPRDGHLVIAYADAHRSAGRVTGLSVVWSSDGVRWSPPIEVSDSAHGTAWLPAIALRPNDAVVTFYTARFAPSPRDSARMQVRWRRLARSAAGYEARDGGVLDEGELAWPGDYHALVVSRGAFVAAYGRDRDIFVRRFAP